MSEQPVVDIPADIAPPSKPALTFSAATRHWLPALILFLCGIISTFLLTNATYRQARRRPECKDIAVAAFCIMLAMVSFLTAILFLSFAYLFYLPALAGLAIALDRTARAEFVSRAALVVEPQQPPWAAPPSGFQTGARRIPPGLAQTARQAAS